MTRSKFRNSFRVPAVKTFRPLKYVGNGDWQIRCETCGGDVEITSVEDQAFRFVCEKGHTLAMNVGKGYLGGVTISTWANPMTKEDHERIAIEDAERIDRVECPEIEPTKIYNTTEEEELESLYHESEMLKADEEWNEMIMLHHPDA